MSLLSLPLQCSIPNPPLHFSTRTHRFAVSCNQQKDHNTPANDQQQTSQSQSQSKIDRRNMLLGMGSLYGAATSNLAPAPATASPIEAPDLTKCTTGTDLNTGKPIVGMDCCPPISEIFDYKLPPVTKLRVRPAAQIVNNDYIAKYEKAVALMKALPADDPRSFDQQAHVHCAYCNLTYEQKGSNTDPPLKLQVHNSWLFFPFHRWYLYFYERILAKLIDDPTFALPFWNWDNPPGMVAPRYFLNPDSPLFDPKRDPAHFPGPATVDLTYSGTSSTTDPDQLVKKNLAEMYKEMVSGATKLEDFYGATYVTGTAPEPGPGSVERGSHTAVHIWVGDPSNDGYDMGNFSTAGFESLFYSHHANIDRLWSIWCDLRKKAKKPCFFSEPDWLNANFVLYDENARLVRVRVRDALEHEKMGYGFQKVDIPWLQKRPVARIRKSKVATTTDARKADAVFPVTLDKVVKVLVDRPRKSRSKKDKEKEEELLVIEGIEVDTAKFVRFDVFVNDEDDNPDDLSKAEYAGCYAQVPHKNSTKVKSKIRLGLTELLEDLDVEDDEQILVTVVPKAGGDDITIGGIKIIYAS